ncbi:MAG: hypothetical protein B6A08_05880 [Sorangiineae bacterium NIC37A_2]|nr:MAG: hypothetical protein B6A08_05880 [Sorangiineae bacterium NIC37A_2]
MKDRKRTPAQEARETSSPARRRGPSGFEAYYEQVLGDRWPSLRASLLSRAERPGEGRVIRENAFSDASARAGHFSRLAPGPVPGTWLFDRSMRADAPDPSGLRLGYVMDPASILPARALPLDGAKNILDLCAAPGGKALILAERAPEDAQITLNDRSSDRVERLKQVFKDYVPPSVRERTRVTREDGRLIFRKYPNLFDGILLDAPCSSEAHVALDPSALADWSEGRVERLAKEQYALVTSALGALRSGGYLVYSTCALAPLENDLVLSRLLERGRHPAEVLELPRAPLTERTSHGLQVLPDRSGFGPIYYALIQKL